MVPPRKKLLLLMIPGVLFWALFGMGIATENQTLIGAGVAVFLCTAVAAVASAVARSNKRNAALLRLWREGEPAVATIKRISTAGGGVNDNPMIDFELDVVRAGGETYSVQASQMISSLAIPRIQPGCQINIKIDPSSPTDLVVDEDLTPYGYKG